MHALHLQPPEPSPREILRTCLHAFSDALATSPRPEPAELRAALVFIREQALAAGIGEGLLTLTVRNAIRDLDACRFDPAYYGRQFVRLVDQL